MAGSTSVSETRFIALSIQERTQFGDCSSTKAKNTEAPPKQTEKSSKKDIGPKFICITARQETILLQHLEKFPVGLANDAKARPRARRLTQKLRVRAQEKQRKTIVLGQNCLLNPWRIGCQAERLY